MVFCAFEDMVKERERQGKEYSIREGLTITDITNAENLVRKFGRL
jgi:hypothetical protein